MQDLTIGIIQSDLYWENPVANRAMFEEKIWSLKQSVDLIVLPEMFTTGFSMNAAALAEPMNLHTFKWMKQVSAQANAVLVGSYIVQEKGEFFNRLIWMQPDGIYYTYDKRHLFRMANEHQTYSAGNAKLVVEYKGWKICPLICYDLRFPVWSRNINLEYDVLLYVANWPEARRHPWNTLLQARAIENLSYVVGVNRVGKDGHGIPYSGDSACISFKGEILWKKEYDEVIHIQTFSKVELNQFREKFPAQMDADEFKFL